MSQCQYEVIYEERTGNGYRRRYKACGNVGSVTGWCDEHNASADLLRAASEAGYPDFVIATIGGQPVYTVSHGKLNWQGYARRHQQGRHSDLMKRLRAMAEMEKVA